MNLSPEISCVLYSGLLWDIIYSGHKFCAFEVIVFGEKF